MSKFPNPQNVYNNAGVVPPALYLNRTDTIDLTVVNSMDLSGFKDNPSTNLHYHGFNVPPQNFPSQTPTDSVYISIDQTVESYEYEFQIPSTHPMGSFWYHPHPHMVSEPQVLGGMSGLLVVRGLIEAYYPDVSQLIGQYLYDNTQGLQPQQPAEKIFLLKDYVPEGAECAVKAVNGSTSFNVTVNGNLPQLWRFANAGADQFYNLQITEQASGGNVQFYVVAVDGNVATTSECTPSTAQTIVACPIVTTNLVIPPGSRMDVLVQFEAGKDYTLMDLGTNTFGGDPNCPIQLGTITVQNISQTNKSLADLVTSRTQTDRLTIQAVQSKWPPCKTISDPSVQNNEVVKFGVSNDKKGFSVLPSGEQYTAGTVNYTVTNAPCWDTWTITNNTDTAGETHVFHIHQLDFFVETAPSGKGVTQGFTPTGNGVFNASPGFQDTLTVPYGETATVLIPFDSNIAGYFVYHCHILNHEDLGMMANICVQAANPPAEQRCTGAPPWPQTRHTGHH